MKKTGTSLLYAKGKKPVKPEKNSKGSNSSPNKVNKKTENRGSPLRESEEAGVKDLCSLEPLEEIKEQVEVKEQAEIEEQAEIKEQEKAKEHPEDKKHFEVQEPPETSQTAEPEPVVEAKPFEEVLITPTVSPVKLKRSRNSQKSLNERKISAELDKIFNESPSKANFRPSVIEKSVRTVSSSPMKNFYSSSTLLTKKEPLFEQLYKIANKPRPEITENPKTDSPTKRKVSPTRKRSEVDKDLYEDAIRRASIHHEKDEYSEITTSIKSQQVLAKKFSKEFLKIIEDLQIPQVSFDSFLVVMKNLRFLKDDDSILALKLWNTINDQNSEKISLEKTLSCLLSLLGIYASQVVNSFLVVSKELNFQTVATALPIHLEMRIHKNFHKLNENRRIPSHKPSNSMTSGFSFAPQLNCKSQSLAKKKYEQLGGLSPLKKIEYYLGEKKKHAEQAQKEKIEKQDKELEECTFVPKIIKKGTSPAKNVVHKTLELYEMAKKNFGKKEEGKVNDEVLK
jgi:hypothetical protein